MQNTDTVLMIEPVMFGYNSETAVNNYFQHYDRKSASRIQQLAMEEFRTMVNQLRERDIQVIVLQDTPEPPKPDSVFPNNWISFHGDKRLAIYPMFAENRRAERRQEIIHAVIHQGFYYSEMVDYSVYEKEGLFLEGTGSMVLDRENNIAYAALSERTDEMLFSWFCSDFGFRGVTFRAYHTAHDKRLPVYHTNVMLSVADQYAVICSECIDNKEERKLVTDSLIESDREIIEISEIQMKNFAGNMLQLRNHSGVRFLVMSQSAYHSLESAQLEKLKSFNELIVCSVPTIEKYGGGSVRCMISEVY